MKKIKLTLAEALIIFAFVGVLVALMPVLASHTVGSDDTAETQSITTESGDGQ